MEDESSENNEVCIMVIMPNTQKVVMEFQVWCKERGYVWTSLDEVLPYVEEVTP